MSEEIARLRWQCRRGMLELDAILQPFFETQFLSLSALQKKDFERLLTQSDQDLFEWFIGKKRPTDPQLEALVVFIKTSLAKYR